MPADKFEKEYAYNIRYNYGKEGKGIDYSPMSCTKIIQGIGPGSDEHHGCPFRHFAETHLINLLRKMGIDTKSSELKEIIDKYK
jgi:DNA primase large subunit